VEPHEACLITQSTIPQKSSLPTLNGFIYRAGSLPYHYPSILKAKDQEPLEWVRTAPFPGSLLFFWIGISSMPITTCLWKSKKVPVNRTVLLRRMPQSVSFWKIWFNFCFNRCLRTGATIVRSHRRCSLCRRSNQVSYMFGLCVRQNL